MNLILDENEMSVKTDHKYSHLTPKKYGILSLLTENPGKTFSAEEIYRSTWNAEPYDCHLIISVHIRHIREKIEKDPSKPEMIKALWGRGYRFTKEHQLA